MSSQQPSFIHYLHFLRRQLWVIALITLVTLGVAAAINATKEPVYRASMKIVVGQGGGVFQPQFGNVFQPFTQTMTNLLESEIVARNVVDNLGLNIKSKEVLADLHVSARPDSSVLDVGYESTNKDAAVAILDEVGNVFTRLVRQKLGRPSGEDAEALPPITATVFDPAYLEPERVGPQPMRSLVFAGFLGLVFGVVMAFVRDRLDNRVHDRRDAEDWFDSPVIASFPRGMVGRPPFGVRGRPAPTKKELLRAPDLLRANLQYAAKDGLIVVVTSAGAEEGKSTVAGNLSVALAMAGESVICVDADLRRPRLGSYLGVADEADHGLPDVLARRVGVEDALGEVELTAVRREEPALEAAVAAAAGGEAIAPRASTATKDGGGSLRVLAARGSRSPQETLESSIRTDELRSMASELRGLADYVVFDAAPLLTGGDVFPLLSVAERVLIVAREGRTTREAATMVAETLRRLDVPDISVVLVEASSLAGAAYY
jgi:polysaccharide biosynthesis transport protein